jgi:hypothetical protein
MAIVDGFRVWIDRLDEALVEQGSNKTHRDFEPAEMLEAYESAITATDFAKNPTPPFAPTQKRNRKLRLISLSRFPLFELVLVVAALFCASLVCDQGMGHFVAAINAETDSRQAIAGTKKIHPTTPIDRKGASKRAQEAFGDFAKELTAGAIDTVLGATALYVMVVLGACISMNRYLKFNLGKRKLKLTRVGGPPFPYA